MPTILGSPPSAASCAGSTLGTAWKLSHDLYYLKRRSRLVNLMVVVETLVIAGLDSHRPLHVPASQFLFGRDLGIDLEADALGPLPPEVREASAPRSGGYLPR